MILIYSRRKKFTIFFTAISTSLVIIYTTISAIFVQNHFSKLNKIMTRGDKKNRKSFTKIIGKSGNAFVDTIPRKLGSTCKGFRTNPDLKGNQLTEGKKLINNNRYEFLKQFPPLKKEQKNIPPENVEVAAKNYCGDIDSETTMTESETTMTESETTGTTMTESETTGSPNLVLSPA